MSKRSIIVSASLSALALAPLGGVAAADRSRVERISAGEINGNGFKFPNAQGISADGARVFFTTDERLLVSDTDGGAVDVYERSGGSTKLISIGETGGSGPSPAEFRGASENGSRVFFHTSERLVASDTDDSQDVYESSEGTTKLVSAGATGGGGAFPAIFRGATPDGRRVFFDTAEKLVSSDTDSSRDTYQREGGGTRRVSVGEINGNGAFDAFFSGVSDDGSRVFFATVEPLVPSDADGAADVYERFGRSTTLVSAGQTGGNGAFHAGFEGASTDGTRVFFDTDEQLVSADTDATDDLYERSGGTTKLLSTGEAGGNGVYSPLLADTSDDGSRVFFVTRERLAFDDSDGGQWDVYERSGGTTKLVSAGEINGNGGFQAFGGSASDDGTRVFFSTPEQLVAADTDARRDVYERSEGTTKLVSAGETGGNGDIEARFRGASADGTRVFFETGEKLVATDTDRYDDVYERIAGTTSRVTPGNGPFDAHFSEVSAEGTVVVFGTDEKLVPGDTDNISDIYAAYDTP